MALVAGLLAEVGTATAAELCADLRLSVATVVGQHLGVASTSCAAMGELVSGRHIFDLMATSPTAVPVGPNGGPT